jgi:CHAT domain-containing protein/Tfp pilus assembly protein PilF
MKPPIRARFGPLIVCALVLMVPSWPISLAEDPPSATDSPLSAEQKARLKEAELLGEQAAKLTGEGKSAEAITALEQKLDIERKVLGNAREEVADSLEELAELYLQRLDFAKARARQQLVLELRLALRGKEHYSVTDARLKLADIDSVARLSIADQDRWRQAEALTIKMKELHQQGKTPEALPLAEKALETQRQLFGDTHLSTAEAFRDLGVLLQHKEDFAAARRCHDQALAIKKKLLGENHPLTALEYVNLAELDRTLGNVESAQSNLERALRILKETYGEAHVDTAAALNNLGGLLLWRGNYAAARPYFEHALAIMKKADDPGVAIAYNNVGYLLYHQRDYEGAQPYYQQALEVIKKTSGDNDLRAAAVLNNLGLLLYSQGKTKEARAYYEQGLAIYKKAWGENHLKVAEALSGLGVLLVREQRYGEARQYFEQALRIEGTVLGPDHPESAENLSNVASTLWLEGKLAEARQKQQQALERITKSLGPTHPHTAAQLSNLGLVLYSQGAYVEARRCFEQALSIRLSFTENVLGTLSEAEALAFTQRLDSGRDQLLSVARHLLDRRPEEVYPAVWDTRALVSRAVARRRIRSDMAPEVRRLWQQLQESRVQLAKLTLAVPPPNKAQARRERLANLNAEKESLERELNRVSPSFRREAASQRTRFTDLEARLPAGVAVVDLVKMNLIEPAVTPTETRKYSHYEAFVLRKADMPQGGSVAWVRLGPAQAIEQAVHEWRRHLLSANGQAASVQAPERTLRRLVWEPIETHLRDCSTVILIPDAALTAVPWAALPGKKPGSFLLEEYALATASHGQQLYDLLNRESPQGNKSLVVGGVHYDSNPVNAPAQQIAVAQRGPARDAKKEFTWQYLPGSLREAEQITALWNRSEPGTLLKGDAAGEATLREQLPLARYVHLATHGFFADPKVPSAFCPSLTGEKLTVGGFEMSGPRSTVTGRNPLILSGIVLAGANVPQKRNEWGAPEGDDGILTAEEVVALDLSGTELTVLSACETGLGEVAGGEGVFGLQRAFHLAGARTVVASLWKVDDRATQVLMQEFYANLWHKGHGKLQALREAQLAMLRHYDLQAGTLRGPQERTRTDPSKPARKAEERLSPFFWAAFVLSGDWR